MTIQGTIITDFGDPIENVNILEVGTLNGTISDANGNYALDLINNTINVEFSHVSYVTKAHRNTIPNPIEMVFGGTNLNEVELTYKPKPIEKPKFKKELILIPIAIAVMIYLGQKSDEKTQKLKLGLNGGKQICSDRHKCDGINKRTDKLRKGHSFKKGGGVVKKTKGLDNNGNLKKGYKWQNKKVVKVNTKKKDSKKPLKVNL